MAELTTIHAAILALQSDLPSIEKSQTADTGKYKYQYAGLNEVTGAILPKLNEFGLTWVTRPTRFEGSNVLAYELTHTSGDSISGYYPLPSNATGQQMGAEITYARRYALCAVTGIAPGGDDTDSKAEKRVKSAVPEATITEWKELINGAQTVTELNLVWKQVADAGLGTEARLIQAGAARKKAIQG